MIELKLQQCRLDDRYNILECLGRGSYAEIYLAQDNQVPEDSEHRLVVIKALNIQLQGDIDADLERTLIENFQNEAIALDRVRHPHIINRLGHGTAIDLSGIVFHYLVLEYLPGGDIFKICRNQPLPLKQTMYYLEQVCSGLSYAHERGVIHRDIKPQNLLLTKNRKTVKIADFGVAKIGAIEGSITRVGTNIYAAPEHNPQVQTAQLTSADTNFNQMKLTPAADIYSLAKTVYVMLTGESPRRFEGHSIKDFPLPISEQLWANEVLKVLRKATRTNPIERHQSIREFWEEFAFAISTGNLTEANRSDETAPVLVKDEKLEQKLEEQLKENIPSRPRFDSTRNLQLKEAVNGSNRPRIVVQFDAAEPAAPALNQPTRPEQQRAREIINAMPDAIAQEHQQRANQPSALASGFKRFLVGLCLLIAFTGMLLATHYFIRGRALWTRGTQETPVEPLIGREGVTTTDVNLRPEPNTSRRSVGLAEQGSTVKVLAVSDEWVQIQVIRHSRPKKDSYSLDQGWILSKYIEFN